MLSPMDDTCDESCSMPIRPRALLSFHSLGTLGAALPFILTFAIVSFLVARHLFPLLAGAASRVDDDYYLPSDAPPALKEAEAKHNTWPLRRRLAAASFGATIALATVLAELILCEISSALDPDARALTLRVTVPALLVLLVLWIPFLEIQSVIRGAGWDFTNRRSGQLNKLPCILQGLIFAAWLAIFWFAGDFTTASSFDNMLAPAPSPSISDAALSRVGVVGVSLMALLSGFASVSSPWQAFFQRSRPVTDSDLARKATGLDATNDLLAAKKSRLRALTHKLADTPSEGFMGRIVGSIRGNPDATEVKALQLEISGLETMAVSLSTSHTLLQARHAAQARAKSPLGRCLIIPDVAFSIYCVYRIIATTVTTLQRSSHPHSTFSTSDPINRVLSLLVKHVDASLDQAAWARQISFLLAGIMLLLSFNSVLQTLHVFSRFAPGLVRQAQANLPLAVAQISAMYVISAALLLRSNLPAEMASGIGQALGKGVDAGFVERWFEGWFLVGGGATALGIWGGRRLGEGEGEGWDDYGGDLELGTKRS
ncbi:hypothetical protein V490_04173 [Pseudogymnoascus sp. VKM F-3557]|nr:hypothetical protein V490_04173 [Pseudogymnoascus sp. VKM F-3557]